MATHPITNHAYRTPSGNRPAVLCIGGNDPAGLAGLQMDCRSCDALGVHAVTAVTATTVQDNHGLYAINPMAPEVLSDQIDAALNLKPAAIKIGLLGSQQQIDMLAQKLPATGLPVVLDTVLATTSDGQVLDAEARDSLRKKLFPLATVVTPNLPESEALLDQPLTGAGGIKKAAQALRAHDAQWVIIKGGHGDSGPVVDHCEGPGHSFGLQQVRVDTPNLRGTGCAFASLVAASLALGYEVRDALVIARMSLHCGIERSVAINGERGCPRPSGFPTDNWPAFTAEDFTTGATSFPACVGDGQPDTLGLYPIVDRASWVARLLPLGVTTIQLRIKDLSGDMLAAEIEQAVTIARRHNARLFINDYWQLAIEKGAYGVHLGQEDLASADLPAIHAAGLRLGISNHCHYEMVRALAVRPSYIAAGPVFATTTKDMPWIPHGIDGLAYWLRAIREFPLVAIAGINALNIDDIAATGVSGIALITAITQAPDPDAITTQLLAKLQKHQNHVQ